MATANLDLDTNQIKNWHSIVTLIVFVVTNVIVLFPFHVPIPFPVVFYNAIWDFLHAVRIIRDRPKHNPRLDSIRHGKDASKSSRYFVFQFPMNMLTAPLIADLFLLAILAIGRTEVHDGTIGANHIAPIDIMVFFLSLAYIAISIDASGLLRWLAFKVLQKSGGNGHALFFYLYTFFFALATFAGNDPIVLSGTAFLAYMTRVSSNIKHPRAWIHMQFSIANIGSAILVSSNPTNLVLAGAFNIKFIQYTANVIVPVVATAVVVFPFLLYVLFNDDGLIPKQIQLHELPAHLREEKPTNPNVKSSNKVGREDDAEEDPDQQQLSMLKEIMNPFLNVPSAVFGTVIMAVTLVTILAINAASQQGSEHPVFWITLPAAFVTFCWDLASDWRHRKETRALARQGGGAAVEMTPSQQSVESKHETQDTPSKQSPLSLANNLQSRAELETAKSENEIATTAATAQHPISTQASSTSSMTANSTSAKPSRTEHTTLQSLFEDAYRWMQATFPTVTTVVEHLPFALVPFAFTMFVLVQALVTKGWVPVFAHGWDHWVNKTGVVGAIGGMAFLSVILCNFAGTNIGTAILLCRVVQSWVAIHEANGTTISQRTFWATVYSMTIGLNYGAFSTAFSASLAGLLWRDILRRKHIHVRSLDFARLNLPIIAISMVIGCVVLVGEVYITRSTEPYSGAS